MPEYGITPTGVNIKRLDVILDELHADLTAGFGFNTRQNPNSFLNVLITNFGDKIAELWEVGAQVYHAMSINTAEGVNLDYVAQLGGATRMMNAKSFYPIHCSGIDGTVLAAGTLIASDTNPVTQLSLAGEQTISRAACNKAVVKLAGTEVAGEYSISLNGTLYRYSAQEDDSDASVLAALADKIKDADFEVMVVAASATMVIQAVDPAVNYPLVLSDNLTTTNVVSVITFGTTEYGDISIPNGAITRILQADSGLKSVENKCGYIPGRIRETDTEFRAKYASRLFTRSSRMGESIVSAILANVQGVTSASYHENCTNVVDEDGRPPHSIEVVVDGGDSAEIAQQILNNKAGGIQTYGSVEVNVPDIYDGNILIRFNRPNYVHCWFSVKLVPSENEPLPPNYVDLIEAVIVDNVAALKAGENVRPQRWTSDFMKACSGIDYLEILVYQTDNASSAPSSSADYTLKAVTVSERHKAVTDLGRIEVYLDES